MMKLKVETDPGTKGNRDTSGNEIKEEDDDHE